MPDAVCPRCNAVVRLGYCDLWLDTEEGRDAMVEALAHARCASSLEGHGREHAASTVRPAPPGQPDGGAQ